MHCGFISSALGILLPYYTHKLIAGRSQKSKNTLSYILRTLESLVWLSILIICQTSTDVFSLVECILGSTLLNKASCHYIMC